MVNDHKKKLMRAKERVKSLKIPQNNKNLILQFAEQLSAEGLSIVRQVKYLYTLGRIAISMDKDFSKTDKQDIVQFCNDINNSDYAEWTKHNYRVIIKRFYKWLKNTDEYPPEVKWIKISVKNSRKKLPSELLTHEDVKKLATHTNNLRDKCFILLLYESGARIGEILNIHIKDVEFDKYGAKLNLFGKTGARKIRVIASAPAISNWLMDHPDRENKNSPLFCGIWSKKRGEEINYQTFRIMLKEVAQKAGIDKPINPHHFRHSRATDLAKKLTEAQLCQYMGWIQSSREAATYVHLSGRDMDNAILTLHGLAEEETQAESFKEIKCPRCGIKNDPSAKFCSGCSLGLDEKSLMDYDLQEEEAKRIGLHSMDMLKDPKLRTIFNEMLAETLEKYMKINEKM